MPSNARDYAYKHELEFIAGLGKWSDNKLDRGYLLGRYRDACSRRDNWINIKKDRVLATLQREIDAL